jgi:flagellin
MSISVQTNVQSFNAQRALTRTERDLSTSMARLSSGLRINIAADDAAGLAISEKLRSQVRGLNQAQRNANDGISMLQTAEGALNEVNDMLIRMRELAVQAANGSLGSAERAALNNEFTAMRSEINRLAAVTEFNGAALVNGSLSTGVTFQVGIDNTTSDRITVSLADADASALGVGTATVSTVTAARSALSTVDTAISRVTTRRGNIGAAQNRLLTTINNLASSQENLAAANSRIRDADIASESASLARNQILLQAGTAVLAQANQLPALALSLLG